MWHIEYKGYIITVVRENDKTFSYIVRNEPNGNEIDACSEFDNEEKCIKEAKLSVDFQLNNL
jgi:hypothetical protein